MLSYLTNHLILFGVRIYISSHFSPHYYSDLVFSACDLLLVASLCPSPPPFAPLTKEACLLKLVISSSFLMFRQMNKYFFHSFSDYLWPNCKVHFFWINSSFRLCSSNDFDHSMLIIAEHAGIVRLVSGRLLMYSLVFSVFAVRSAASFYYNYSCTLALLTAFKISWMPWFYSFMFTDLLQLHWN